MMETTFQGDTHAHCSYLGLDGEQQHDSSHRLRNHLQRPVLEAQHVGKVKESSGEAKSSNVLQGKGAGGDMAILCWLTMTSMAGEGDNATLFMISGFDSRGSCRTRTQPQH